MLKNLQKYIAVILIALLLSLSACSNQDSEYTSTDNTEKSSNSIATPSENSIDVYSGPGDDYIKLTSITSTQIQEKLKYEKDWIEVDYGNKRGYVRADECDDVDINKIPHVVYSISSNMYPYPTLYNVRVDITLFDEASVYSTPKSSGSPIIVNQNESVLILCHEKSALKDYIQIEYSTEKGKRRGYCDSVDLLSLDNPLVNFAEVKHKNACIKYENTEYYSSSGEVTSYSNGWHKKDEKKLSKTEVDWLAGIVGVIAGNDINKEAIESTQGKLQLYDTKDQQYKNANASDTIKAAQADIVDFLIGSTISFLDNGVKTTTLDVRMDEYNGEKRIVIRTGVPIEFAKAGKETTLSSLIVEKENTALSLVESDKRADEKIKQMYPNLDKNKTYSMKMTFSKDFDGNNYGYYIVIDKNAEVYAVPIIHPGTSFQVFSEDGFVYDAAWDLATAMIKVDENSKKTILNLLLENGFEINGYSNRAVDGNIPSDAFGYNGHHYYFYKENCETWEDAKAFCENLGGHLAIINNEEENTKLYDFMKSSNIDSAYFGLTDVEKEGVWKNVDGSNAEFINWSDGEPNNERGIENYAMFYFKSSAYHWNDGDFSHGTENDPAIFICEWDY